MWDGGLKASLEKSLWIKYVPAAPTQVLNPLLHNPKSKTFLFWTADWTTCPRAFRRLSAYWLQIWSIHLPPTPAFPIGVNPLPLGGAQPTARSVLIGSGRRCSGAENPPPAFRWPKDRSVGS